MDFIRTVEGVNGQTFTITIAPPGSGLDSDLYHGRWLGALIDTVSGVVRSGHKKWRVAEIAEGIRTETWHPWRD